MLYPLSYKRRWSRLNTTCWISLRQTAYFAL